MPSVVKPESLDQLENFATKQLLGLRDRLLACESSLAESDPLPQDVETEIDPSRIRFKDDPRWVDLYQAVKAELSTREHVDGGDQRRAIRKEQAKAQRSHQRGRRKQQ